MSQSPSDVKDYSEGKEDTHFNGVSSWYGRLVNQQNKQQPRYCEPGEAGGPMEGEHRNISKDHNELICRPFC